MFLILMEMVYLCLGKSKIVFGLICILVYEIESFKFYSLWANFNDLSLPLFIIKQ